MSQEPVCIIYTGGTLGMCPSPAGYVPARDLGALLHSRLPELSDDSMPAYELVELEEPMESANATPRLWHELAQLISASSERHDGFVIIHGTDTLAYTASALSFLLCDFEKPVLLTGSQIPLAEVRNDAQGNLISAMQVIAARRLREVAVCFGRYVLRGNRTTKVRSTHLDAFDSPNLPALVQIGSALRFTEVGALPTRVEDLQGDPPPYRHCNIATLRVFPGMQDRLIDAIVETGAAGIVLRCYGVGTAPTADRRLLAALRRATDAGIVVVAVSQCLQGSVALGRYAAGSALADVGVVSGFDMTTEAAFTKLHALFAFGKQSAEVAGLMQQNLRGELTVAI